MSNDCKKITFSFSKVKKPPIFNKADAKHKDEKEYVDCFDGSKGKFSYKGNFRNDTSHKEELIIPMPVGGTSGDIVKSHIEKKIGKNFNLSQKNGEEEKKCEAETSHMSHSIEELAAFEILSEVKNNSVENKVTNKLIIETKNLPQETNENDIDYENVPVTDFGLAMLRGMGWKPDLGIGKEPRLVEAVSPKLRLKGLGLGAQLNAETVKESKDNGNKELKKFSNKKQDKH